MVHVTCNVVIAVYISVNGQWGQWTAWTACDKASCGHQLRERQCDSPAPSFKGDECVGKANETQMCNTDGCDGNKIFLINYKIALGGVILGDIQI